MDGMNVTQGTNDMNDMQGAFGTDPIMADEYMQVRRPDPKEEMKAARKHFSRLGLMFFLATIFIYALELVIDIVLSMLKPEWMMDYNVNLILGTVCTYFIGMPVLAGLLRLVPASSVERRSFNAGHFALATMIAYTILIASNIIGLIITFIVGLLKGSLVDNALIEMASSVNFPLLLFATVVCAPVIEEYMFRKMIVDRTIRYGQGVAVFVSGLMFGLFHGNLNQFAYAVTLGMFLAYLYSRTGQLKLTIGIHLIVNLLGSIGSWIVTNGIDLTELQDAAQSSDYNAMMSFYGQNFFAFAFLILYEFCVFGLAIAGLVLFIIALVKRRFFLLPGEVSIPKGKRFTTVIVNVGMLLFCIFWIFQILWQLLS